MLYCGRVHQRYSNPNEFGPTKGRILVPEYLLTQQHRNNTWFKFTPMGCAWTIINELSKIARLYHSKFNVKLWSDIICKVSLESDGIYLHQLGKITPEKYPD